MFKNKFSLVAQTAVKRAGKLLMADFEHIHTKYRKGKSDFATEVDKASEKLIIEEIQRHFPTHSILSEESGLHANDAQYIWIIDPIDGTINYYYGSHPFRVGVCLLEDKKPIVTAVYNPARKGLYFAERGKGATFNGKTIRVSQNDKIADAIVMTHLSSNDTARRRTIAALDNIFVHTMHMRMFGSGLAAMSYVAAGKFDIFFNIKTNPWDILPGVLLIEEAGGRVTDIEGKPITPTSTSVLATNGKVHDKMLQLLKGI